jgi:hypothetical protein
MDAQCVHRFCTFSNVAKLAADAPSVSDLSIHRSHATSGTGLNDGHGLGAHQIVGMDGINRTPLS